MNFTKTVKDVYSESCNTLMKETEKDTNKCKDTPYSQTGRIYIVKMFILPKVIYRFNTIPNKISMAFFTKYINIKICMELQKTPYIQSNFVKKEQS